MYYKNKGNPIYFWATLYFFLKKIILLFHYNPVVLRFGFDFGMFGGIHHLN